MEGYIDVIKKLIKSMKETSELLSEYENIRSGVAEDEFNAYIEKSDMVELEELQEEYDKYGKIIKRNL